MDADEQDDTTSDLARVLYESAVLRSGFALKDSADFSSRIERMLRLSLGVDLSAEVEEEVFDEDQDDEEEDDDEEDIDFEEDEGKTL